MNSEFISLADQFEIQATLTPERVAVSYRSNTITYKELDEKSSQVAHYLISHNTRKGFLVAIYMERSIDFVIALIGVLKSGCAYIPIDYNMPINRVNAILNDCSPYAIITTSVFNQNIITSAIVINISADWSSISDKPIHRPNVSVAVDDLFYVIYTSGLTGHPKAVRGVYRGIINRLNWIWKEYPYGGDELACQRISISFVGHVAELFAPLLKGIKLIILPDIQANNALDLVKTISVRNITRIVLVPSFLKSILSVSAEQIFHFPKLKYVFCSGEALSVSVARLFYQRFKHACLINVYGATEVSADATWYEVKRFDVDNVLAYFSKSFESLPCHYPGSRFNAEDQSEHEITAPDISVNELVVRFMNTKMTNCPMDTEKYFDWFESEVMPYSINTASPLYIGHMTSALPDFVHDMSKLISQMNQNLVKIETAKSAIFLEREVISILHRCFYGFSDSFYKKYVQKVNTNLGLVTTGGTISNITALMIARNRALEKLSGDDNNLSTASLHQILQASDYKDLVLLGSDLMHYSIKKSISLLGIGINNIINVSSAAGGVLDIRDLNDRLAYCHEKKLYVFAIVGIAGATETGHIDPLEQMADIAKQHDIYFHVDAAWGGGGLFSDKYRSRFKGIERADSITFCAHKQLYLPQGISLCLFRDPDILKYGATAAVYQSGPDSYDVGRFSMEGSRSAMALLVHASLQMIGKKGYEALFNASVEKSVFFARIIDSMECFELIFDPPLNIVNYRYIPEEYRDKLIYNTLNSDDNSKINIINQHIQDSQFIKGSTFVSKTILKYTCYGTDQSIVVFRAILANPLTTQKDIFRVLEDQLMIANKICGDNNSHELHGDEEGTLSMANAFADNIMLQEKTDEILVPIGKPLPNCRVYLLDENMNLVSDGQIGEIYIGGDVISPGYLHQQKEYPDLFVKDPFSDDINTRLFHTGDRGKRKESGDIEYIGRNDDLIQIGEHCIELSEIESILSEIEIVQYCAVTAEIDEQSNKYLVAHIELINRRTKNSSLDDIKSIAAHKLPIWMLPGVYRILDKIPFTLSGKIDRNKLKISENEDQHLQKIALI